MRSLVPWKRKPTAALPSLRAADWFGLTEDPFADIAFPWKPAGIPRFPSIDVTEGHKEVTVRAEVPGMSEKDIELSWLHGVLRIRGQKREEKEERKAGCYRRECNYGSFSRDIELGDNVDFQNASAKYRNGVLTVRLPRTGQTRKAVEIHIN